MNKETYVIINDLKNIFLRGDLGFITTSKYPLKSTGNYENLYHNVKDESLTPHFNDSVITSNSTFLEIVDSHNRSRGMNCAFGLLVLIGSLLGTLPLLFEIFSRDHISPIGYFIISIIIIFYLFIIPLTNMLIRTDMFRKTHYPIRFNRKNRKVYAWSQDKGVVKFDWDDIQFYKNWTTLKQQAKGVYKCDIRGCVKDKKGDPKYYLIFVKYEGYKGIQGALEVWELIRSYMEEPDGYIKASAIEQRVLSLNSRRESFVDSLTQATQLMADSKFLQFIAAVQTTWAGTGRLLSKWSCKVPKWPSWVEKECVIEKNDPYIRNIDNEKKRTYFEISWPIFLYFLGWGELILFIIYMFSDYI